MYMHSGLLLNILTVAQVKPLDVAAITLCITGFLCLLNVLLIMRFRKRGLKEVLSYIAAIVIELGIFLFALLFYLRLVTSVPFHLPPGLLFNRAELGAALAIAVGLFPAAYWHRTSWADLGKRMEKDAQILKARNGGVRVKGPSEWMN